MKLTVYNADYRKLNSTKQLSASTTVSVGTCVCNTSVLCLGCCKDNAVYDVYLAVSPPYLISLPLTSLFPLPVNSNMI